MGFYIWQNQSGQWLWVLRKDNYDIIAVSGNVYMTREECLDSIALVKQSASVKVTERAI